MKTEEQKKSNEKLENLGKNLEKIGCISIFLITIPIILTIFLGIPGLIIGIIVAIIGISSILGKKNNNKKKGEK